MTGNVARLKVEATVKQTARWRGIAIAGYVVIFMTFGVLGIWASIAKLDRAVVADAFVAMETNQKTIQHLEGGIVREILVNEGDHVEEGQVLIRLQSIQAQANKELLKDQLNSYLTLEARLLAERAHKDEIDWPDKFNEGLTDPFLVDAISDQTHQFHERRASLEGQIGVFNSRTEQLEQEISGISIERKSTEDQLRFIEKELEGLRVLAAKRIVPTPRVLAQEREKARLEGIIGRSIADTAKANSTIGEMRIHIGQLEQKFQEDVAAALLDVRQKIASVRERYTVAKDVLERIDLKAPRSGTVQNLKVFTIGQVIRSADDLMEIVPDDERLVIHASILPDDRDGVHDGQQAEIRFPSFRSRDTPIMIGYLDTVSRNRMIDEQSRQFYYLAVILLNRSDIPESYRARITPGMRAEVIVATGERTVLNYIVAPLFNSLHKSFKEK